MGNERKEVEEKGEEVKKKGRPTSAERFKMERRNSTGGIEDLLRRKRERQEDEIMVEEEKEKAFRTSKKVARSPTGKGGQEGDIMEMLNHMREEIAEGREEARERATGQEEWLKGEIEGLKEEMWKMGEKWKKEKEELKKEVRELGMRVEKVERLGGSGGRRLEERMEKLEISVEQRRIGGVKDGGEEMERRFRELEWKMEEKEREERRKNIVIRGMEDKGKTVKEGVEELFRIMGIQERIESVKKVGAGGEIVVVKLKEQETKRKVMEEKKKLAGRKESIEADLTWRERKMKRKLEAIAEGERKRGERVWVRYSRVMIVGCWWKWDERNEVLRDIKGREWGKEAAREEEQGKPGEGKGGPQENGG